MPTMGVKTMVVVGLALVVGPVTSYHLQYLSQYKFRAMLPILDHVMMKMKMKMGMVMLESVLY